MNLVERLKPHLKDIQRWKNTGRFEGDAQALVPIYEEYWRDNQHIGAGTVQLKCPSCVKDMLTALYNSYQKELRYFKGVPEKPTVKKLIVNLEVLTWPELKKYAKERGVNTYKKNRAQIESELND